MWTEAVFVCDALSQAAIISILWIKETKYKAWGFHEEWSGMRARNGVGDYAITQIGPVRPCCLGTNSLSVRPVTQFTSAVKWKQKLRYSQA
jgi:hypothetical protein